MIDQIHSEAVPPQLGEHLARERHGHGTLALERSPVERGDESGQAPRVAFDAVQHVGGYVAFQPHAACLGPLLQEAEPLRIVEWLDVEHQALADAGAQILAQRQSQRRGVTAHHQPLLEFACAIVGVEERMLQPRGGALHVVEEKDRLRRLRQRFAGEMLCGEVVYGASVALGELGGGDQKVRATAA